ncbi:ExeM/NucH family extracellular endonuclease [Kocuria sp.]|uniref:ExeM/NucH family extracellular endonuclease n=1 Tax=Kocuria sp. TaxID=1871328 RepID=UPI0026DF0FBF|nr:ExeM/NucH family extracellular endonuclease [Kocuria sp.]MDO5617990.1 ExeM/NucH family extracellular endonuclease [Kocuria sp.]
MTLNLRTRFWALPAAALLALPTSVVIAAPAGAEPVPEQPALGDHVVINEAYVNGGSANAPYTHKFVELYNPTDTAVDLTGWSLQYRSATGTGPSNNVVQLTGTIEPGEFYLVAGGSNGTAGQPLPQADLDAGSRLNPAGTRGTFVLSDAATALALPAGSVTGTDGVVDLLGYGTTNTFEAAAAPAPTANNDPRSLNRTDSVDTDNNSVDFTLSTEVTPQTGAGETSPAEPSAPATDTPSSSPSAEPTGEPGELLSIAQIQGTGEATPYLNQTVRTRGVVTAVYATGGLNGFQVQTEGTGGDLGADHSASDGIFVYAPNALNAVQLGDHVELTGTAQEYFGQTQLSVQPAGISVLSEPAQAVKPAEIAWPASDAEREALEGMLLQPTGSFTVTNNYGLNTYGEVGLAFGDDVLRTPTDVAAPGSAEASAVEADNTARKVILDDGSTWNYGNLSTYGDQPLPYLSLENPVRMGSTVTFDQPVVLGYGHNEWRLQPLQQVTGDSLDAVPVVFQNDRSEYAAPADVGGDVQLGTFNVLNYFTTLGTDEPGCASYNDRSGNPLTTRNCNVRGAYDQDSFQAQQDKLVSAINGLDAGVVSLEEIENSARFDQDRDAALSTLVDALNADAGTDKWAYVPSPAAVPAAEDVIRTAFIYQPARVEAVGESAILDDQVNFSNAREPLAQTFRPAGGDATDDFVVVVNHFKSKGSGASATGDNVDTGQGAWNGDRTRQSQAMLAFAQEFADSAGTDRVFLVGDFNSYTFEDPMQVLYNSGFVNIAPEGQYSYAFDGMAGSLDHVVASPAAAAAVTGSDVWEINANESIGMEYSRQNYNVVNLFAPDQFRASDHNPALVGFSTSNSAEPTPEPSGEPSQEPTPGPSTQPTTPVKQGPPTSHPGQGKGIPDHVRDRWGTTTGPRR